MFESEKLHAHHRKRLRDRLIDCGANALEEHEMLELLLFRPIRRRNTNVLAHRLIDRFGSIYNVLEADREELMSVDGVGETTADYLCKLGRAVEFCVRDADNALLKIGSPGDAYACADEFFHAYPFARCVFLVLDGFNGLITAAELSAAPTARELIQTALKYGAQRAILVFKDIMSIPAETALSLAKAFSVMGVRLVDCMTVGISYSSVFAELSDHPTVYLEPQATEGAVLLHSEMPDGGLKYSDKPEAKPQEDALPELLAAQLDPTVAPDYVSETQRLVDNAKRRTLPEKPGNDDSSAGFAEAFVNADDLPAEMLEILKNSSDI